MLKIKRLILIITAVLCLIPLSSCLDTHEHTFGEWTVIEEAGCGSDGLQSRICSECDYEEFSQIPAPAHSFISATVKPTCTEQGYTEYVCECGYSYKTDYVIPLGHKLIEEKTLPSCTEHGYTHFSCEVCEYAFDGAFVEPLAHKNSSARVFYPTVTHSGYTEYTCLDCEHIYREDFIAYTDILPHAHVESNGILSRGIDVSYHNHSGDEINGYQPLDWEAIKAAGVDYVILRAGYTTAKDPTFEMDYRDAKAAGLGVGAYFYTYSATLHGTVEDAYDMLSYIEGKQFEYPIYFDLEEKVNPQLHTLSKEHLTELCVTFIEILQEHGYYCGLYVNHDWLYNILDTDTIKSKFDVWYARYPADPSETDPDHKIMWTDTELEWNEAKYGKQLGMWQYTEWGYLDADGKRFDFNYCYKDYPEIMKKWHLNGY